DGRVTQRIRNRVRQFRPGDDVRPHANQLGCALPRAALGSFPLAPDIPMPPAMQQQCALWFADHHRSQYRDNIIADRDASATRFALALARAWDHQALLVEQTVGDPHTDKLREPRTGRSEQHDDAMQIAVPFYLLVDLFRRSQYTAD